MAAPPDSAARQASPAEGLVTAVAVTSILYFGREIFVPLALAILISFVLSPAALFLRRFLGRTLSVLTVIALAACLVLGLSAIIATQITGLAQSLPSYENALSQKIENIKGYGGLSSMFGRAGDTLRHLGREIEQSQTNQEKPSGLSADAGKPVPVEIRQPQRAIWDQYSSLLVSISGPLATAAIVLVFLLFIMLQREDLRDRIIRLAGLQSVQQSTEALDDAGRRLSRFFITQTAINTGFGCVMGAGLALIGIPNAILFGAVAGIMRFVPFVGSFIAAAIPLVLAAGAEPGWTTFFWTLALYVVGESIVGQVIEPLGYGRTTGLSPFAVIVAASFWTWLWGPVGLLMAVPLTVCFVVFASHVERFKFLYILLADQPPLTPPQQFYQRMLAGNTDEAVRGAEQYLKSNSLCRYYTEVAIPGLMLGHRDWERGILNKPRLAEIYETVEELIEVLGDYAAALPERRKTPDEPSSPDLPALSPDLLPPEWKSKQVLAIGGRTPLDLAGAAILAQLLNKHGIPAYAPSPAEAAGRYSGIPCAPLICISYFGASAAYAHVHGTIRRLRSVQPGAQLLLCAWEASETAAPAAVVCVKSLHSAVAYALKLAQAETAQAPASSQPERPAPDTGHGA